MHALQAASARPVVPGSLLCGELRVWPWWAEAHACAPSSVSPINRRKHFASGSVHVAAMVGGRSCMRSVQHQPDQLYLGLHSWGNTVCLFKVWSMHGGQQVMHAFPAVCARLEALGPVLIWGSQVWRVVVWMLSSLQHGPDQQHQAPGSLGKKGGTTGRGCGGLNVIPALRLVFARPAAPCTPLVVICRMWPWRLICESCVSCSISRTSSTRQSALGDAVPDMLDVNMSQIRVLQGALAGAAGPAD